MKSKIISIFTIIIFILCITNCDIVFDGTLTGINMWLFKVVPTLFPFILLTAFMRKTGATKHITRIFSPFLCPALGISESACFIIFTGLMCGYPISARLCSDMMTAGELSPGEADYLQTFTNNISPSFLFSYVGNVLLEGRLSMSTLFLVYYVPVILTSIILNPFYRGSFGSLSAADSHRKTENDSVIISSVNTILSIGIYIIIFSIMCSAISSVEFIKHKSILLGILEITTGTLAVSESSMDFSVKCIAILLLSSFGGLSSFFQVRHVITDRRMTVKHYAIGKGMCFVVTAIMCILMLNHL